MGQHKLLLGVAGEPLVPRSVRAASKRARRRAGRDGPRKQACGRAERAGVQLRGAVGCGVYCGHHGRAETTRSHRTVVVRSTKHQDASAFR
ncbi:hypothetical protein [Deinococcus peraridilitoris]|uniref:hypothetical protein n=1 Tax=Deinococcus peraridilitoris TaxID=432329 RepID=UPI003CCB92E0